MVRNLVFAGYLLVCSLSAVAQELDFKSLEMPGVIRTSVGVTRLGTPIPAFITSDDLNVHSPKIRLLIVAGLDGSSRTSAAAINVMHRFYTEPAYAPVRNVLALSVVPCGNPDGLAKKLKNDNGSGGNPAAGYPPAGDAYLSSTNPEAQYLWRWIGMHAPDSVEVLVEGETTAHVPESDRANDSLAVQLGLKSACNVGTIEASMRSVAPGDLTPFSEFTPAMFADFVQAVQGQAGKFSSPARLEMQARDRRTALEVAGQLAKVYGHELPTVAYIPAVACIGRLRLAKLTKDAAVFPDLEKITADYRTGTKPTLTDKSSGSDIAGHILWGEMFDESKNSRYIEMARFAADRAFTEDGQPRDAMPTHSEMSDAVFMGCPILAQVGRLTGDRKYYDMCLKHMRFMLKLNLRSDGLHRHSPLDETAWGRGNGFPALGLALSLNELPQDYPGRQEMLSAFQQHLTALLAHQDPTGAWHQVVDHPESYRELTSTCMITYAMARGVQKGWLDAEKFKPAIERGWSAVKARVAADGTLVDVCTGTGKMKSLREYLDRTAILGRDPRGGAMALLVATEMAQWEKSSGK
ncbi:MAG: glycoside hydrolase family 88 protein [Pirellulaceae bacterium]|nr:glycoside hydrolase family 88 protein [Pirellulaceae bacterium]